MIQKLLCKIFGHDWVFWDGDEERLSYYECRWCREQKYNK